MHISETTFTVNRHCALKIPAAILREMGLAPGDHVRVAYLTHDGQRNTFQEFWLSADPLDGQTEEDRVQIPTELLVQADIPGDADLRIICLKGALLICRDTAFNLAELRLISEDLKIADDLIGYLPKEKGPAIDDLSILINDLKGRVNDHDEL